jgi:hypothetical protein
LRKLIEPAPWKRNIASQFPESGRRTHPEIRFRKLSAMCVEELPVRPLFGKQGTCHRQSGWTSGEQADDPELDGIDELQYDASLGETAC